MTALWSGTNQTENERIAKASKNLKDPHRLHLTHAQLQERQGNLDSARTSYEIALSHNSKSVDAVLGLARLDQLAGRMDKAEKGYLKALKIQPNNPQAFDAAGQFYASQDQWDKSVEMLKSAMMAAPDEATYRYHLAVALASSGKINEAMPHFVKTIGEAEAHYNVGYILHEKGDLAGAKRQLTQAVLKKPELTVAQQLLDELNNDQNDQIMITSTPASIKRQRSRVPVSAPNRASAQSAVQTPFGVSAGSAGRVSTTGWRRTNGLQKSVAPQQKFPNRATSNQGISAPNPFAGLDNSGIQETRTLSPEQIEQMKNQFGSATRRGN
ncbi:MAG: tetratricopeptide repeat protein [Planctomycetes bacterium]|nr:tetratricopeptide repeat protein [Planctomycetota bacterium]